MTEGGDRVYAKTPTMKKHSEQELQQIAQRASKSIPGAARFVIIFLLCHVSFYCAVLMLTLALNLELLCPALSLQSETTSDGRVCIT